MYSYHHPPCLYFPWQKNQFTLQCQHLGWLGRQNFGTLRTPYWTQHYQTPVVFQIRLIPKFKTSFYDSKSFLLRNVFEFHSLVIFIRELPYFLKNRQSFYLKATSTHWKFKTTAKYVGFLNKKIVFYHSVQQPNFQMKN